MEDNYITRRILPFRMWHQELWQAYTWANISVEPAGSFVIYPDYGGGSCLWQFCTYAPHYTASYPGRHSS